VRSATRARSLRVGTPSRPFHGLRVAIRCWWSLRRLCVAVAMIDGQCRRGEGELTRTRIGARYSSRVVGCVLFAKPFDGFGVVVDLDR